MSRARLAAALTAAVLALSLGGCATPFGQKIEGVFSALSGATVDPQAVIIESNIADGLQRTATNYLQLTKCNGSNGPICRDPAVTKKLIPAVRSLRVARNNLQAFLVQHPGQLGPQGLYDALSAAVSTLQSIITTNSIGATK